MAIFEVSRRKRARKLIEGTDLSKAVEKARLHFDLKDDETELALRDYRHYFYLVYWNRREGNQIQVVPTTRADKIWHGHLLYTQDYRSFCESLVGRFIDHNPGLEEGSTAFIEAVAHTKLLHDRRGAEGFNPEYFSHITVVRSKEHKETTSSGGDDGSVTIIIASGDGDGGDGSGCGSCGD